MNRQYFFALNELVKGNVRRRFSGNYLMIIWYVLAPFACTAFMSGLFSGFTGFSISDYHVFYLTGHIIFFLFASIVVQCAGAIADNRRMFAETRLSRGIFIVSRVLSGMILSAFSLVEYPVLMIVYDIKPSIRMLACIPILILVIAIATGLGMIFSVSAVFWKNYKYPMEMILAVLFFGSAVFYPAESLASGINVIIRYNPIFLAIDAIRGIVLGGTLPTMEVWLKLALLAIVVVIVGEIVYFAGRKSILLCED